MKDKVYNGIIELEKLAFDWNQKAFITIDVKELTNICDQYTKSLMSAERQIPDNKAIPIFKRNLYIFKDAIPVISALRCPYLEENDFIKIQSLLKTNINFKGDEELTLGEFLKLPFQEHQEEIIDISVWATQYYYLKNELDGFEEEWLVSVLKLKQYKETSEIVIIYEIDELTVKLDESLAVASSIISNRYIGPLRERAEKILNDIIVAQEIIEKMIECQKRWIYLENIFSAQDIKKQLMAEATQFANADKFLKNLTKKLFGKPLISRLLKTLNLANDLARILESLEEI